MNVKIYNISHHNKWHIYTKIYKNIYKNLGLVHAACATNESHVCICFFLYKMCIVYLYLSISIYIIYNSRRYEC